MFFNESFLQICLYLVLCIAVIMYTILDGFDLGVGVLHLFVKSDQDRRILLNSIGPIWDGNTVWLIIVGGALFAGFPIAFGTIFSAFYTLTMMYLAGIIFRVAAIEFRSKHPSKNWRNFWDIIFCVSSTVIAFGAGILLANIIRGLPIDQEMNFQGNFWDFISFYSVLVGLMSVALFTVHGLTFLLMKTEGELHARLRRFVNPVMVVFGILYALTTLDTLVNNPHMLERFRGNTVLYIIPIIAILSMISIPYQIHKKRDRLAFVFSSLSILTPYLLFAIGTYPMILRSTIDPQNLSLTIFNSSAGEQTLKVVLLIVLIGIPLVFGYGYFLYKIFKGKVKLDSSSY